MPCIARPGPNSQVLTNTRGLYDMLVPILLFTTLNGLCYARFTSFDDAATLTSIS